MTTKNRKAVIKPRSALVARKPVLSGTTSAANSFALEIRIRGKTEYLHQEVCSGLEDAVRIGQKWFKAFQSRNPWFVQDSKQKRIFILLDPEAETLLR